LQKLILNSALRTRKIQGLGNDKSWAREALAATTWGASAYYYYYYYFIVLCSIYFIVV